MSQPHGRRAAQVLARSKWQHLHRSSICWYWSSCRTTSLVNMRWRPCPNGGQISPTSAVKWSIPTLSQPQRLFFGMTQGHVDAVMNHFPQAKGKTFLVRNSWKDWSNIKKIFLIRSVGTLRFIVIAGTKLPRAFKLSFIDLSKRMFPQVHLDW